MPNCNDLWIDNKMTVLQMFLSTQKVEFSLRYDFLKSNALRILERRKYLGKYSICSETLNDSYVESDIKGGRRSNFLRYLASKWSFWGLFVM